MTVVFGADRCINLKMVNLILFSADRIVDYGIGRADRNIIFNCHESRKIKKASFWMPFFVAGSRIELPTLGL